MDSTTAGSARPYDILLLGGLWLRPEVWDPVVTALTARGHRPLAVSLPGQGDDNDAATLSDQLQAVLSAIDAAQAPVLVGHSASAGLAWLAVDRRPTRVLHAVLIGGFPAADGAAYADLFDVVDGVMPFPGWEPFEGPDAADLDDELRDRIAARTVPVPEAVARGVVHLTDVRRLDVPVTLVCPEFTPVEAKAWVDGEVAELDAVQRLSYVDIDSGHWPMITRPAELAALIAAAAESVDTHDAQ